MDAKKGTISAKAKKVLLKFRTGESALKFRKSMNPPMSQADFWGKVGVTQSAGSRYESGRRVPIQVAALLAIAFEPTIVGVDAVVGDIETGALFKGE